MGILQGKFLKRLWGIYTPPQGAGFLAYSIQVLLVCLLVPICSENRQGQLQTASPIPVKTMPSQHGTAIARPTRIQIPSKLTSSACGHPHVSEPEFWASLARKWALHVHACDVTRARRIGLGKCPPQRSLHDVEHGDWKALCARLGVPPHRASRFQDAAARRLVHETGRG